MRVLCASVSFDGNMVLWEVVYNHVVDETKENDNRGLCGYFNKKDKGG